VVPFILTPVMRLIARIYPAQFPYHLNCKADWTHPATQELATSPR
jgi:hypothetical protein